MTDTNQAAAPAAEAATPVEFKSKAVPSVYAQPEAPKPEPVQEAPAQDVEATGEADDAEAELPEDPATSDGNDAPAKPKNKGVGKRINELTKERHDALRERDYWREQAMRTQQGEPPAAQDPQARAAVQEAGEPKLEDFDFDVSKFNRAHYQWLRDQDRKQEQAHARLGTLREKESAFEVEHPDYRDVVYAPNVPITQSMAEVMLGTDNAPAVAYHLATHLDEAAAIAKLPPIQQAIAIGRIDAQLSAPPASPASPPPALPKKTTNAPPPPKTVSGAGQPQVTEDDPSISTAQRIALWKKGRPRGSR